MSAIARTFVLRGSDDAKRLYAFLKQNAAAMADQGQPLEAVVRVHKAHASDAQRSLIWLINGQIAEQAWIAGRQFDADTWHEHCKRQLLPEENARGMKKWRHLPDDSRELAMGTENLDREEKTVYIDQLLAFAGSLGVTVEIEAREPA